MEYEVLEILIQSLTEDRMNRIIDKDEEYQAALTREREVHDSLESMLSKEQRELFNEFISAASETGANIERINYRQGMKDMFALLKSLL